MMSEPGTGNHREDRLSPLRGSIYAILDETFLKAEEVPGAAAALTGAGVRVLQLRMKKSSPRQLLKIARELVEILRGKDILLLINDYPDIAFLSGAGGVHLGQDDIPAHEARKLLGKDAVIGISTHSRQEVEEAVKEGPDYIAIGPIFDTTTKDGRKMKGLGGERFQELAGMVSMPVVAIGGITDENIQEVPLHASAAVISFLYRGDPGENARKLMERKDRSVSG